MSLGSQRTTGTNRHYDRATSQSIQMMGVWGWLAILSFGAYLAVSCLASHIERRINASVQEGSNPLFDHPVEFGGKLTAPGEFILVHAEALAYGWLAIIVIAMLIWLNRKYKL